MSIQQDQPQVPCQPPIDKKDQVVEKQNVIASLLAKYNPSPAVVVPNPFQSELVTQKPCNMTIQDLDAKPRQTNNSPNQQFLQRWTRKGRRHKKQATTIVIDDQPQPIIYQEPRYLNSNPNSDQKALDAIGSKLQKFQQLDAVNKIFYKPEHQPQKIVQNCNINQAKEFIQGQISQSLRFQEFQYSGPIGEELNQIQHSKTIHQVQPNVLPSNNPTYKLNQTSNVKLDEKFLQQRGQNSPHKTYYNKFGPISRIFDSQEAEKMTNEELKQYISSLLSPNKDDLKGLTREDLIEVLRQVLKERKEQIEWQKKATNIEKRPYIKLTEEQKTLIYQILIMNERYERSLQKMSKEDIEDVLQAYAQENPQVLNQNQEMYMKIHQQGQISSARPCSLQTEGISQMISQPPYLVDQSKTSCLRTSQEELNFIFQKVSQNEPGLLNDISGLTQSQFLQVIDELKSQMQSQRLSMANHERFSAQQYRLTAADERLYNSRTNNTSQALENRTQHFFQRDGTESLSSNRPFAHKSANKTNYPKSKKLQGLFGKEKANNISPSQANEPKTNIQRKNTFPYQKIKIVRQPYEMILSEKQAEDSQCEQYLEQSIQQRCLQHVQRRSNDQRQEARKNLNTRDLSEKTMRNQIDRSRKDNFDRTAQKQTCSSSKLFQNSELSKIIQQIGILPDQNKSYETLQRDQDGNLMAKTIVVIHTQYCKRQNLKVYGQDQKPQKRVKKNNSDPNDQPPLQIIHQPLTNSRQLQTQQLQNDVIKPKQIQTRILTQQETQLKDKIRGIMRDTMGNSQNRANSDKSMQKVLKSILQQLQ